MLPQALFCTPSTALRQPEHRNEPAPCVCVRAHHIPLTSRVCNVEFVSRALPSASPPSFPILLSACVRVAVHTQVPTNAPRCTPPTHDQRRHHRSAHSTQCSAFRPPNTTPFLMLWGMPQNSVRPQRPLHTLHTPVAPSNNPTPRLVRERPACAWLRGPGGAVRQRDGPFQPPPQCSTNARNNDRAAVQSQEVFEPHSAPAQHTRKRDDRATPQHSDWVTSSEGERLLGSQRLLALTVDG